MAPAMQRPSIFPMLLGLSATAAAQPPTTVPTPAEIEAAFQQAARAELAAIDNPFLQSLASRFQVDRLHGCRPDGDALRCLVEITAGMDWESSARVVSMRRTPQGWRMLPDLDGSSFPPPTPAEATQLLRDAHRHGQPAAPPLHTGVQSIEACRVSCWREDAPGTGYRRHVAVECEVRFQPATTADTDVQTLQLMPVGERWQLGPVSGDAP